MAVTFFIIFLRVPMRAHPYISCSVLVFTLGFAVNALAQSAASESTPSVAAPNGRDLLQSRCAQCHSDAMWRDQRQDAKAWEATLYRMMGRGAVWSADDIVSMASFLGTELGPQVPKIKR